MPRAAKPHPGGSEEVGGRVRLYQRGRTWYANFQHRGRQHRRTLGTPNKKEARARAARLDADLARGTFGVTAAATVAAADAAYLESLRVEERAATTVAKYTSVLGRVLDLAAERRVADVSGLDLGFVDAYRLRRTVAGRAAKTRYTEAVIIRQLVNFALSRNLLAADPLKGLKLTKPKPTPQPCWTPAEVARILAACPADVRPPLALLAETGLRFGELAWLTWDDVDRAANVVRVRPKAGWRPKSGDQRAVPISAALAAVLDGLPRRYRWVVTMPPSKRCPHPGRPWAERPLLAALKRVLEGVGLTGKLHTFRHAFISGSLLGGAPVAVVKAWVGHVDDKILAMYTHVRDDASQLAMRRLSAVSPEPPADTGSAG